MTRISVSALSAVRAASFSANLTRITIERQDQLRRSGANVGTVAELLRHARELLDIIEDEIANGLSATADDARTVLALRRRLESLEQDLIATKR